MIKDHQDLLDRFYEADGICIDQLSTKIDEDRQKLKEEVDNYAEQNGLISPAKDE